MLIHVKEPCPVHGEDPVNASSFSGFAIVDGDDFLSLRAWRNEQMTQGLILGPNASPDPRGTLTINEAISKSVGSFSPDPKCILKWL